MSHQASKIIRLENSSIVENNKVIGKIYDEIHCKMKETGK